MKTESLTEQLPEPKLHAISVDEFKVVPQELEHYTPLDKVTRNNFISFLIKSFEVSRGDPQALSVFLVWLKLKSNFDYVATLENFFQAGHWMTLSNEEKKEFEN